MVGADTNFPEPQQEAAFFYGLFLRGEPLQKLREDIDIPPRVLERWQKLVNQEPWFKPTLDHMLNYRKHVLAIFDSLVLCEMKAEQRLQ